MGREVETVKNFSTGEEEGIQRYEILEDQKNHDGLERNFPSQGGRRSSHPLQITFLHQTINLTKQFIHGHDDF